MDGTVYIHVLHRNSIASQSLTRGQPEILHTDRKIQSEPREIGVKKYIGVDAAVVVAVKVIIKSYILQLPAVGYDAWLVPQRLTVTVGGAEECAGNCQTCVDDGQTARLQSVFHTLFQCAAAVGCLASHCKVGLGLIRQILDQRSASGGVWVEAGSIVAVICISMNKSGTAETICHILAEICHGKSVATITDVGADFPFEVPGSLQTVVGHVLYIGPHIHHPIVFHIVVIVELLEIRIEFFRIKICCYRHLCMPSGSGCEFESERIVSDIGRRQTPDKVEARVKIRLTAQFISAVEMQKLSLSQTGRQ